MQHKTGRVLKELSFETPVMRSWPPIDGEKAAFTRVFIFNPEAEIRHFLEDPAFQQSVIFNC